MFYPVISRRQAYKGVAGVYTYRKYKVEILEDCIHRCVYCDGHGSSFGGHEMMELDHVRPKAPNLFPKLKNEPTNLVLACRSCNGKKSDDWPAAVHATITHEAGKGYIHPFEVDRRDYFTVEDSGRVSAKQDPAGYMIEQLALNRPFAVVIRARRLQRQKLLLAIDGLVCALRQVCKRPHTETELQEIADLLEQASSELKTLFDEDALS